MDGLSFLTSKGNNPMRKSIIFGFIAATFMSLLCGCLTSPAPEGAAYSAYAVGDRTRVALDEVVVSLPMKGATQPYQNLHVGLAATINPVKTTLHEPYTVSGIIQRLEARIGARVLEFLSGTKVQSLDDMASLRAQIAREAQNVVDEGMHRWQYGSDYDVKVLVVSLYWTDASVGRTPTIRHSWW
jgi:hypothetical protein